MKNKVRNVLAALVLCMSAVVLPVTAYASTGSDTTPPTLSATLNNDKLAVEASDDMSGCLLYTSLSNLRQVTEYAARHESRFVKPVSYTHLDVYKRQIIQRGGISMTEDEAYKVHIQYTFNAFCKLDKLFTHQIIKGNFPFPPPAQLQNYIYGCVTNDNLAKGIECVLDMHFVGDVYKRQALAYLHLSSGTLM